jgi:N-formylglutamate amidohydrolase
LFPAEYQMAEKSGARRSPLLIWTTGWIRCIGLIMPRLKLIDLHSMPPLKSVRGEQVARLVIGDRHGSSASFSLVDRLMLEAESAGFATALNAPYAGGHILERHGQPGRGTHAIQLEVDRSLYLDPALDQPGPGLPVVSRLILRIADALADEAGAMPFAIAAE